ncbi:MaoC/PaaZ C-terminal domain-containing protein [Sporosarcina sp. CAU 1771]
MKFNEFKVGQTFQSDSMIVTKEEVLDFAHKYDPQHIHIDEEKASKGRFGGLIASGIQTVGITWRKCVDLDLFGEDLITGAGIKNVSFARPVYPDDELYVKVEIIQMEQSTEEDGLITVLLSTFNQHNKKVLDMEARVIIQV